MTIIHIREPFFSIKYWRHVATQRDLQLSVFMLDCGFTFLNPSAKVRSRRERKANRMGFLAFFATPHLCIGLWFLAIDINAHLITFITGLSDTLHKRESRHSPPARQ